VAAIDNEAAVHTRASPVTPEFKGTKRFEVLRVLGAGGMGVVYEAFDRERQVRVALKTIRSVNPQAIYYLKREFRAVADLVHPNLVRLHELIFDDARWFFTMELIDGRDFLDHVCGIEGKASALNRTFRPDVGTLRAAMLQLVTGIKALHDHGRLHRDIKPSNALVTADGRVVLLDFGLVVEPNAVDPYQTFDRGVVGTPAYLAPEQVAAPGQTSPSSDWYSVGVLLYEALTGQVPFVSFSGSLAELIAVKLSREPPAPAAVAPWIPDDLNALCVSLLAQDPRARPSAEEIIRRLGGMTTAPVTATTVARTDPRGLLIGREPQIAALNEAFALSRGGQPVVVFVHGSSGAGKTALLDHVAAMLAERRGAVVVSGRCFEREHVPYRALDNLVDTLTRYLVTLPAQEVEAILPRDIQALARLFPVLRRVPAIGGARLRSESTAEPQELRQRAFGAMRDLLGRIADRRPLVMCIDDLQWGDVDSATLLRAVLRPPAPPPILAIASYRTEDAAQSACIRVLLEESDQGDGPDRTRRIFVNVDSLAPEEARELAMTLLSGTRSAAQSAETIARESGGNPLLLHQLADYLRSPPRAELDPATVGKELTLDDVLRSRLGELSSEGRRLLEVIAVAGRPISLDIGNEVAGIAPGDRNGVSELRVNRLARTKDGERTIEMVHDRIRQSVVAQIGPAAMALCHRRLAVALEGRPEVDPEVLASHFFGGGDLSRASEYASSAADRANQALAFDRAARLFRWAIDLRQAPLADDGGTDKPIDDQTRALLVKLGDALANSGKGAAAAEAFLSATRGANSNDQLEYRRRAAEQYLKSGHIDESTEILRTVLAAFGVKLAATPRRALLSLAYRRARLKMRGFKFRPRDSSLITARELTRVDVLWSLSAGFGHVDSLRAADLQARHLLLALKLGDPYRIARALTFEAAFSATGGKRSHARTARLVKLAEAIAKSMDRPYTQGWAVLARGMASYLEGDHRNGGIDCEEAENIFRHSCTGVAHEINIARLFAVYSLVWLGDFAELSRRVPRLLKEAEDNGDLYLATNLRTGLPNSTWLIMDDPETARAQVLEGMRRWSKRSFHNQHFFDMSAEIDIDLYRGEPEAAHARLVAGWPRLKSSLTLRIQTVFVRALSLRARSSLALAAARQGSARSELLASVDADAKRLESEALACSIPQGELLRAGACVVRGDVESARKLLERAATGFDGAEMKAYASMTRLRLGQLLGGDEGKALIEREVVWQRSQSVRSPERFARVLAPGFGDLS
jgi:tetratricopeptide (TPR) repeat protein